MSDTRIRARDFLAHTVASDGQIKKWVDQFHQDEFLFLPKVLTPEVVEMLCSDLDRELEGREPSTSGSRIELHPRMFETSPTNLSLFRYGADRQLC